MVIFASASAPIKATFITFHSCKLIKLTNSLVRERAAEFTKKACLNDAFLTIKCSLSIEIKITRLTKSCDFSLAVFWKNF